MISYDDLKKNKFVIVPGEWNAENGNDNQGQEKIIGKYRYKNQKMLLEMLLLLALEQRWLYVIQNFSR